MKLTADSSSSMSRLLTGMMNFDQPSLLAASNHFPAVLSMLGIAARSGEDGAAAFPAPACPPNRPTLRPPEKLHPEFNICVTIAVPAFRSGSWSAAPEFDSSRDPMQVENADNMKPIGSAF